MFLFSLVWASPFFFPFSFFVSLLLLSFFLPSCFFHLSFWFFLFLFVWFASWLKMLSCFSFSACCLLLFWIIMFDLFLLCILFSSSCCFLVFVAFIFCIFWILATYQKTSLKKLEIAKNPKMKNAQKKDILTRAVSTGVLTNSVFFSFLRFFKFCIFCWKHYKNRGFSPKKKKQKHKKNKQPSVKNWSKLALKTGPSMLRNKIGPVFNARNVVFFCFLFLLFFEKSSSFCRENEIFKNKKTKKTKNWTSF